MDPGSPCSTVLSKTINYLKSRRSTLTAVIQDFKAICVCLHSALTCLSRHLISIVGVLLISHNIPISGVFSKSLRLGFRNQLDGHNLIINQQNTCDIIPTKYTQFTFSHTYILTLNRLPICIWDFSILAP